MKKKKKHKLNFNFYTLLFFLLIILLIKNITSYKKVEENIINNKINQSNLINKEYDIIKKDTNPNYIGIGQETVKNKDGYFTTFSTKNNKKYIEYKQNYGYWRSKNYWNSTMEESGCAITSLSIILSGYDSNYTPEDLRKKYYPRIDSNKISSELYNTFNIENTDFYYDQVRLSKENILKHLKNDKPILICVWANEKENRWTTESHYMVLLAADSNNNVYVSNPNGLKNSSKSSGWYNINEIHPYIAKAMFITK